jgi:hypothetical protein
MMDNFFYWLGVASVCCVGGPMALGLWLLTYEATIRGYSYILKRGRYAKTLKTQETEK